MSYILCLETSTTNCSVSLAKEGELVLLKEDYDTKYSHAERLHHFIDEIIKESKLSFSDLSAISVSKGPGSYTGLRIGVSAAKGLCYALGIPLISIPTLQALAMQIQQSEDCYIVPMIDARRMEVYSAIFNASYDQIRDTKAQILEEDSFSEYLQQGKVYFIGNGVEKFSAICQHDNANFILGKLPSSKEMAILTYRKWLNHDFEDVGYFEPYYLKDFVAG